jgi:hypothetical protein
MFHVSHAYTRHPRNPFPNTPSQTTDTSDKPSSLTWRLNLARGTCFVRMSAVCSGSRRQYSSSLVLEGPVSGLEKDRNWTGLDWKKTGLQSWSLIFKNQRPQKDRSLWTGLDQFKPVSCTLQLPL